MEKQDKIEKEINKELEKERVATPEEQLAIEKKPKIYLDTNFIRDNLELRNQNSIELMGKMRDNRWSCFTSIFSFMELSDNKKEDLFFLDALNKKKEARTILREIKSLKLDINHFKQVEKYIKNASVFLKFVQTSDILDSEGWELALRLSSSSTLWAPDVLHLATAWITNCNIIITSDTDFTKEATRILKEVDLWDKILRICNSSKVIENLKEMGFKNI